MSPDRTTLEPGDGAADEAEDTLDAAFEAELGDAARTKRPNALVRLYRGQTAYDFIGNRRWWFGISAVIIVVGVLSMGVRGFNWSIDFRGGQSWEVSSQNLTVAQATTAVENAGLVQPTVVQFTNHASGLRQIQVTADLNSKSVAERNAIEARVQTSLAKASDKTLNQVSVSDVGASWGSEVTNRAILALIIFFIVIAIYISIRFEFKMAVAAIAAVLHDILVTAGIYSLTGFQVTPDTVVAVLTVLGYSLYDTVVVFDRIRENAKGLGASGRVTYSDMVNLSMNQTLARSINTSLVAIIPVLSVLVVGAYFLGAISLEDFGLALVIGLTSGAYSSIFIASPLLAMMKEREPRYVTIRQRLETRGDRVGILTPAAAAAMAGAGAAGGSRSQSRSRGTAGGVLRPGGTSAPRAAAAASSRSSGGPQKAGGARASSTGTARPGGNRPPPRPRKGKGKGKGKRH